MNRDIKSDNIKGVLIFLVVLGHTIGTSKEGLENIVNFIYSFHMPAFILISGYYSKNPTLKKILNLILLYLIFQSFYSVVRFYTGDYSQIQFTYGRPHTHLWYIVSMGFWYGLALLIKVLPLNKVYKGILVLALLVVAFYSRLFAGDVIDIIKQYYENMHTQTLSILRTFVFMPFFLAGYFLSAHRMKRLYSSMSILKGYKFTFIFILSVLTMLFLSKYPDRYDLLFYGFLGYERFAIESQTYVTSVLFHYAISGIGIYLLFNAVGEGKGIFTKWGKNSLSIFLFHMIVIFYLLNNHEWLDNLSPDVRLVVEVSIAIGLTYFLGSTRFNHIVKYLVHPLNTIIMIWKGIWRRWAR